MDRVNEGSTAYLTITLKDADGDLATPVSLRYRIDCLTTGQQVRDWTALSAASQVTVTLTIADNDVLAPTANSEEVRRVTVEASYGDTDKTTAEFDYVVRNLSGVA